MSIINKSLYPVNSTITSINRMNKQFADLQTQLTTGNKYNSLAQMGGDRVHDLNLRARLTRIEGFQANITTTENRLSFYTIGLERLAEIKADARALAVPGAYGTDGINLTNAQNQATGLLKEVIDIFNSDASGQYIFGGNKTDTKPVANFDEMMIGFDAVVQSHLGDHGALPDQRGLVDVDRTDGVVTLTSDDQGNGIQLVGGTRAIDLSAVSPGSAVTINYTLPGSDEMRTITLNAVPTDVEPVMGKTFQAVLDADGNVDAAATAENFETALEEALDFVATGALRSAATYAAADDYFGVDGETGSGGWYLGQSADNPRQSVSANIDEHTKVHFGVQANEVGFVELIKGLAVFAASDLSPLDDVNAARYDTLVDIQRSRLSPEHNAKPGSIEVITMELGLAASSTNTVKSRHTQYGAQLENMLADISKAPLEEVAMMLLTLQTQLQASYQTTAMANQLSLVNYLR